MLKPFTTIKSVLLCCTLLFNVLATHAQKKPLFNVIAFYTAKADMAHISYVQEANRWLPQMAKKC